MKLSAKFMKPATRAFMPSYCYKQKYGPGIPTMKDPAGLFVGWEYYLWFRPLRLAVTLSSLKSSFGVAQ